MEELDSDQPEDERRGLRKELDAEQGKCYGDLE